jgi:hypothetical protein
MKRQQMRSFIKLDDINPLDLLLILGERFHEKEFLYFEFSPSILAAVLQKMSFDFHAGEALLTRSTDRFLTFAIIVCRWLAEPLIGIFSFQSPRAQSHRHLRPHLASSPSVRSAHGRGFGDFVARYLQRSNAEIIEISISRFVRCSFLLTLNCEPN